MAFMNITPVLLALCVSCGGDLQNVNIPERGLHGLGSAFILDPEPPIYNSGGVQTLHHIQNYRFGQSLDFYSRPRTSHIQFQRCTDSASHTELQVRTKSGLSF